VRNPANKQVNKPSENHYLLGINKNTANEKALRDMQKLRAGCSKVEPKIFAPTQTPFPGAQDCQNLIS